MKDHVYKLIELVGISTIGIEGAVNNALARARKALKNMRWFKMAHWQVTLKIGLTIENPT